MFFMGFPVKFIRFPENIHNLNCVQYFVGIDRFSRRFFLDCVVNGPQISIVFQIYMVLKTTSVKYPIHKSYIVLKWKISQTAISMLSIIFHRFYQHNESTNELVASVIFRWHTLGQESFV